MSFHESNLVIKLSINSKEDGGVLLHKDIDSEQIGIWSQIWTGDKTDAVFNKKTLNVPLVHSIFIEFPDNEKLEPGKTYDKINAYIRSYEPINKNFNLNKKFNLLAGLKPWATGEVLEILNDKEIKDKK